MENRITCSLLKIFRKDRLLFEDYFTNGKKEKADERTYLTSLVRRALLKDPAIPQPSEEERFISFAKENEASGKTQELKGIAEKVVLLLKEDPFTQPIFSFTKQHEFDEWNIAHKVEFDYRVDDISVPAQYRFDLIYVNREDQMLQPYKIVLLNNNDFTGAYLSLDYYIENGYAHKAVKAFKHQDPGFKKFQILPYRFIVVNYASLRLRPVTYVTSFSDDYRARQGFSVGGVYYPGSDELIKDLDYAVSNNQFSATMHSIKNDGQLQLFVNYEN